MRSRAVTAGVALVAVLALLAGCVKAKPAAPTVTELAAAMKILSTGTYLATITRTANSQPARTDHASVDPTRPAFLLVNTDPSGGFIHSLAVDGEYYGKYSTGQLATGKWLRVDTNRLPLRRLNIDKLSDPLGSEHVLSGFYAVEKVGDRQYRGRLDMTKMLPYQKGKPKGMEGDIKAVPFEATVDGQGRIASVTYAMRISGKEWKFERTYTDFGAKLTIDKPSADETTDAPEAYYATYGV